MEKVILVNESDEPIGLMEKMEAHEKAVLHRAFSVFVFDDAGRMLLQRRAHSKYHSPGLWTNTCCSHQREGESSEVAAHRRLEEEMGFDCDLQEVFTFIYKAEFDNGLTEHELDHVLIGKWTGEPDFNKEEVSEWKYIALDELSADIKANADHYTVWFKIAYPKVLDFVNKNSLVKKG